MSLNQSCVSEACLPAKTWGICYNDNYSSINTHWYYALYLVFFNILYLFQLGVCGVAVYQYAKVKGAGALMKSNRYQVLTTLTLGALVRGISFYDTNCVIDELLLFLKDLLVVCSFLFIVLFWVEAQTQMRRTSSVDRMRPYLIGIMVLYGALRAGQFAFKLLSSQPPGVEKGTPVDAFTKQKSQDTMEKLFRFSSIGLLAIIGAVAMVFAYKMLKALSKMQAAAAQAKLRRMTKFIIAEVVLLVVLAILVSIRTTAFGDWKRTKPEAYFAVKLPEKVMEFITVLLLQQLVAPSHLSMRALGSRVFPCIRPPTSMDSKAGGRKGPSAVKVEGSSSGGGGSRGGGSRGGGGRGGGGGAAATATDSSGEGGGGSRGGGGRGGGGRGGRGGGFAVKKTEERMAPIGVSTARQVELTSLQPKERDNSAGSSSGAADVNPDADAADISSMETTVNPMQTALQ